MNYIEREAERKFLKMNGFFKTGRQNNDAQTSVRRHGQKIRLDG